MSCQADQYDLSTLQVQSQAAYHPVNVQLLGADESLQMDSGIEGTCPVVHIRWGGMIMSIAHKSLKLLNK